MQLLYFLKTVFANFKFLDFCLINHVWTIILTAQGKRPFAAPLRHFRVLLKQLARSNIKIFRLNYILCLNLGIQHETTITSLTTVTTTTTKQEQLGHHAQ